MCDVGGIIVPFLVYRLTDIWHELPLVVFGKNPQAMSERKPLFLGTSIVLPQNRHHACQ